MVHFVTDQCNARCAHCFMDFKNPVATSDRLSLREIEHLTTTMGTSLYNVNLTGGEPFLRDDLFDIASAYFKNTGVESVIITSNGTLTDSISSFLERFNRSALKGRVKISLSIDDFEEQHDANRSMQGAFRKALASYELIAACRDDRVMADIALTVTPYNFQNVTKIYAALKRRGIKNFSAILMREQGIVTSIPRKPEVINAYVHLASQIREDQQRHGNIPAKHRIPEAIRRAKNKIVQDIVADTYCAPRYMTACTAGSLFGVISPRGDVFPCEILGRPWCFGNVRDTDLDFMRLWQGDRSVALKKDLRRTRCHCTYECAWSVNVLTKPVFLGRMLMRSTGNLIGNR